jgi:thiamine biosynthesis lipoprotein
VSILAPVLLAATLVGSGGAARSVAFPFRTMGTVAQVVVVAADSAAAAPAVAAAVAAFVRVDSLMSNWTTTSEVARLNRDAGRGPTPVHAEVAEVIAAALEVGAASDGAFDITVEPLVRAWGFLGGPLRVPGDAELRRAAARVGARHLQFEVAGRTLGFDRPDVRIDLGGIAKGHAVDEAARALRAHGVTAALVDVSGNMWAMGHPEGATAWRIGIRDPRDRVAHFARLRLAERAISTSGKYEQSVTRDGRTFGHIMDPRSGRPAEGLISVTVLAPTARAADAWSTALFVLGPAEARRVAKARADLDAVLVEPGGEGPDIVWIEATLKDLTDFVPAADTLFRVMWF